MVLSEYTLVCIHMVLSVYTYGTQTLRLSPCLPCGPQVLICQTPGVSSIDPSKPTFGIRAPRLEPFAVQIRES